MLFDVIVYIGIVFIVVVQVGGVDGVFGLGQVDVYWYIFVFVGLVWVWLDVDYVEVVQFGQ